MRYMFVASCAIQMLLLTASSCSQDPPPIDSSLFWAAKTGQISKIWSYIDQGGDLDTPDIRNRTLLHWAAIGGQLDIARLLLDRGVSINSRDNAQATPLYCAIDQGRFEADPSHHVRVALLLISRGADVNAREILLRSPLYAAVKLGDLQLAKQLMARGADPNAAGKNSPPPLHESAGKPEIAWLLATGGAKIDARGPTGGTALHQAAISGDEMVARLLIDRGAFLGARDDQGFAPWQRALQAGHQHLAQVLR